MHGPVRSRFALALVAASALLLVACGEKGKSDDGKVAKQEAKGGSGDVEAKAEAGAAEEGKADAGAAEEGKADAGAAEEGKADAGAAEAGAAEAGAAEAGAAEAGAAEAGAAEAGAAEAGAAEAGAAEAGAEAGAVPDVDTLLTEVKNKKTKDDRAMAALTEAETAGAKARDLAKAAKSRGDALYETPDRAKPFYEWASAKDPKYPDAAFALAKIAANLGEIEEAKTFLRQVHERKGKKLLAQIAYDPMWEIVKDDPEVKGWYEGG